MGGGGVAEEACERGERLRQRVSVREGGYGFLQRLQAGGVFGMLLQHGSHRNARVQEGRRS